MESIYSEQNLTENRVRFNQFENGVSYHPDEKTLNLQISDSSEFACQYQFSNVSEEQKQNHLIELLRENTSETQKTRTEENNKYFKKFTCRFAVEQRENEPNLPPELEKIPYNNILSGASVTVPLGEGILDFIYSDIDAGSKRFHDLLKFEELLNKLDSIDSEEDTFSFNSKEDEDFYYYKRFEATMLGYKELIYSSLYTAAFPPVFTDEKCKSKSYNFYCSYLKNLQNDYREMIEFCFDENFYPDVLENLHPFERYNFYKTIKGHSVTSVRTETFEIHSRAMRGAKMPYGMPSDELIKRLRGNVNKTEQFADFCNKYGLSESATEARIMFPVFIRTKYNISDLNEMLELEFTKMLESNLKFKKCKRCGRYFIMKGNYDTNYCDRVADGEIRSCQELAAQDNFKEKNRNNEPLKIYNKYYKRYAARINVCRLKESEFNRWKAEASAMRDECSSGKITLDEFIRWNESVFPNRSQKK